jgi:hypothetical protein
VTSVRFRSLGEYGTTVAALQTACEQRRDARGVLPAEHTLLLTTLVTARRRRTPGSGVVLDLADEQIALAVATLGDNHPRASAFVR